MITFALAIVANVKKEYSLIEEHYRKELGAHYSQEGHAPVIEMEHWISLAELLQPSTICEIGFNAGHSAAAWTQHYPKSQYISFDLFNKNVSHVARLHLNTRNIRYIIGNTAQTLIDNKFDCDVISIDGDHSYKGALRDLQNMQRHANPQHVIIMDDLLCKWWWCHPPTKAWKEMISLGYIEQIGCKTIGCCTGWCWGKYKKASL